MTFEETIHSDLHQYLLSLQEVDAHLPEAPDIEAKWPGVGQSYMADGIREFQDFPTVSLGWMMYVGMAVAAYWDKDWEALCQQRDVYAALREPRGFDAMDEYIREEVLDLKGEAFTAMEKVVGECASRVYARLRRGGPEPGTPAAFHAYVECIHQMYLFGAFLWLKRMGYHMTKMEA